MATDKIELWDKFINDWPISRIESMTINEYTQVGNENTFTYWVEFKLNVLGSIKGSPSFKFGIYHRNDKKSITNSSSRSYSDDYAWSTKYGTTPEEAFTKVKKAIIEVVKNITSGNLISQTSHTLKQLIPDTFLVFRAVA